jgi:hypothetical protein
MGIIRYFTVQVALSFGLWFAVFTAMIVPPGTAKADGHWISDFPLVVFCEFNGIGNVYYLSEVSRDKVAIYLTPDKQAGTITIDGTAQTVGGDRSGNCKDRTIEDLRAAGQAFDVPQSVD